MGNVYRLLPREEFPRLEDFCERNGILMPNPDLASVAVTEVNGEIRSTHWAQTAIHLDGFCIDRDFKGYVNWLKQFKTLESKFEHVDGLRIYTQPTFPNGPRMLEIAKFTASEYPLYYKDYRSEEHK